MQEEINKIRSSSFMGKMKFLLKDSVLYGVVGMLSRLMGIFLVPVIARVFAPEEYGVVDNIRIVYEIVLAFCLFGLNQAVARFIFQTEDQQERKSIISEAMLFNLGLCLLTCTILFFNGDFVLSYFSIPEGSRTFEFRLMVLAIPFTLFTVFFQMLLKWHFKRAQYMLISIGGPLTLVLFSLFFILKLELGLAGVFYGQLASSSLIALVGFFLCKEHFIIPQKFSHLGKMMRFSFPMLGDTLLLSFMPAVDRKVISEYLTSSDMGTYALGERFSRLINILTGAFNVSWGPFAYSVYKEHDAVKIYSRVFTLYVVALTSIGLFFLSVSEPLIILFASEKYLSSLQIIPFLLFGFIAESFQEVLGMGILLSKKTIYNTLSYLVHLGVSITAMILLVGPYGIVGVGAGFLCGKMGLVISKHIFSQYTYNMKIPVFKELLLFVSSVLAIIFIENMQGLDVLSKGIIYAVLGMVVALTGFLFLISKEDSRKLLQKIKNRKKGV